MIDFGKKKQSVYNRKSYEKHKEERVERRRKYYREHHEECLAQARAWRKAHPDYFKQRKAKGGKDEVP